MKASAVLSVIFLMVAVLPSFAQSGAKGISRALCIGTDEYLYWKKLGNPVFDAKSVAAGLKASDFKTRLVQNPTHADLLAEIKELAMKDYGNNGQLFLFIAGHGFYDETRKEGYLVTRESRPRDFRNVSYMSFTRLRGLLDLIKAKRVFLVMDVCFGGSFDTSAARGGGRETPFVAFDTEGKGGELSKKKCRIYLTSGGLEYVPDGRAGSHSPFAARFLEALSSGGGADGVLTVSEILSHFGGLSPQPSAGYFGAEGAGGEFLIGK